MTGIIRGVWTALSSKPILGLLGIIVLQAVAIWAISGQRGQLQRWQDDVTQATRDAADHPKLATRAVPQQVRNLGIGLAKARTAMAQAKADALAAKLATDAANETRRKDSDDAIAPVLRKALGGADAYARAHGDTGRLQCAPRTAQVDRGDDSRADLPGSAAPADVVDRSGAGPALVFISRAALDTCTTLKVRLDNAHDWAVGGRQ